MKHLFFLLFPLFAHSQCEYDRFPLLNGNVYIEGVGIHLTVWDTRTNYTISVRTKFPHDTGGVFQYRWLGSKIGNSWQLLKNSCENYIILDKSYRSRLQLQVWYYNFASKKGGTSRIHEINLNQFTQLKLN